LSRPETPITVGALGALLAHDVARAGVPPELVRSTAQAASLSTAGKAVTAGVVSAEVARLTGEVLKTMLINKLTLTTAMLLVVLALAAGGTSLTYRAHATEAANQKKDSEKPRGPSNPAEAVQAETPPPKDDQPKPTEASKDDQPKPTEAPKDQERVTKGETKPATLVVENWTSNYQPKVDCGVYSFTALRTGNAAVAYNATTREVKAVRLRASKEKPLRVTPVVIESSNPQVVALGVKGEGITRVALFNLNSGKWVPLDLDQPVNGAVWPMSFGSDTMAYEVGDVLYLYNPKTDAWDRLDTRTLGDDKQEPRVTKGR
jgi:hypothetical protein